MNRLNIKTLSLFLYIAFFLFASNLYALTLSSFTLKGISISPYEYEDFNYQGNLLKGTYSATYAAGTYEVNDTGNLKPDYNIGQEGDGLLNGEADKNGNVIFPGGAFIGDAYGNYLQDVDGDGVDDPGWIMLAAAEIDDDDDDTTTTTTTYEKLAGGVIDIGDLLQIYFNFSVEWTTGQWVLWTDPAKAAEVYGILGSKTFDNLAFVIKTSTKWAVYDFNFNTIFGLEKNAGNTAALSFDTPYTLWGSFSDVDFTNNGNLRNISHFSIWARDPDVSPAPAPEPGTMLLFGFGLLGLAGVSRKKLHK